MTAAVVLFMLIAVIAVSAAILYLSVRTPIVRLDGELQPVNRQDLFAPDDCEIELVLVKPGDLVQVGQVLARFRSDDLEAQQETILDAIQSLQQQYAASKSAMLVGIESDRAELAKLAGQLEHWGTEIENLKRQRERIKASIEALELRSPMQGQVMAAGEFEMFPGRPVLRGQPLMKVVAVTGPWRLELPAEDARLGAILQAQAASEEPLQVQYRLAGESRSWRDGEVEDILRRASDPQPASCVVKVKIDPADIDPSLLRVGAKVQARLRQGS